MPSEHSQDQPEDNVEPPALPASMHDPTIEGYVKRSDEQGNVFRRES